MIRLWLMMLVVLGVASGNVAAQGLPPADAAGLTRERLASGLEVWVYPVPGSGEVSVALIISAGSLDESDGQRGSAYIAKRAAGFGTPNASPELLGTLRSVPGEPDSIIDPLAGDHAYVTHASVVYGMVFDADSDQIESAWAASLGHAADLLNEWSPSDGQIEMARDAAIARESPSKPEYVARGLFIADIFEGQRLGERPLVPPGDVIAGTTNELVRSYIRERYVPGASTVLIAGDIDPGGALVRARAAFGGLPATPARPSVPAIRGQRINGRVSAHAVEGYPSPEASLLTIVSDRADPRGGPDRRVIDETAAELVRARLRPAVLLADPDAESVEVVVTGGVRGLRIAEVAVKSSSDGLEATAAAAAGELANLLAHGFAADEYVSARAEVLASFEARARKWSSGSLKDKQYALVAAARMREAWIEPGEARDHAARVLARTPDARLLDAVRVSFDTRALNCILLSPEPIDAVSAETGERLIRIAQERNPKRLASEVPARLLGSGAGSEVVEISNDPPTGVWSCTLGNGVVVRARAMPGAERAVVRLAFNAGVIDEDARTRGRTRDAMAAWAYPSSGELGAPVIHAWAAQRGLTFSGEIVQNRAVLTIGGPAGSADDLMHLAAALTGSPGVDPNYTGRVSAADPETSPALDALGGMMLAPGDPRAGTNPPNTDIDPRKVGVWLGKICAAPVEVSVVGDLDPTAVIASASETLGNLQARETPGNEWRERWGALPAGETTKRVSGGTARAGYTLGVVFADANDLDIVRPMVVAGRSLDGYLKDLARTGRLPCEPRAFVWLGDGVPDRVTLLISIETDPEMINLCVSALDEAVASFLRDDAADELIQKNIDLAVVGVRSALERPDFWSSRLCSLASFGLEIDSVSGMLDAYESLTPEDVRDAMERALNTGVQKRVIVVPGG